MKILQGLTHYTGRIRLFRPNARLYLTNVVLFGLGTGVYRLLFNFYILSQGYGEGFLGTLITVNNLVALLGALPIAAVSDRLGRKRSFLVTGILSVLATTGVVLWRSRAGFISMSVLSGLAMSLMGVTGAPFMMENSGEEERSYLFSFSFGLQTLAGFLGNSVGGSLPTWLGKFMDISPTSTEAYAWSLLFSAVTGTLALLPIIMLKRQHTATQANSILAPFHYAGRNLSLLGKLIGPMLIISLGAGLLIPFLNVFYRNTYERPDTTIGLLFALGSLSMGLGLLIAPPLAERTGKIRMVVLTQALSIPFLFLLGFAPWFELSALAYLVRGALMNMANPIYQAFVMEQVDEESRAIVASLTSMSWNFGWAFSPQLSGWVQENYGFSPLFWGTAFTYVLSTYLSYHYFVRQRLSKSPPGSAAKLE